MTGGLGFLGQYIVHYILENEKNCSIRIVSRSNDKEMMFDFHKDRRVEFVACDLTAEKEFRFLEGVDFVVHNAAVVSFASKDNEAMERLNVDATRNIVDACRRYKIKRLVYVSSISAVAVTGTRGILADETRFQDPEDEKVNYYTKSKAKAESVLNKAARGMDYVVGCPALIIGRGDKKFKKALKIMAASPVIPVTDSILSIVDVRDVSSALYFLLKKGKAGERYIITQPPLPLREFIDMIISAAKKKKLIVNIPRFVMWFLLPPVKLYEKFSKRPIVTSANIYSAFSYKEFSSKKLVSLGFKFKYPIRNTVGWLMEK